MNEQIEYTLAAVDAASRRPLAMRGGFAQPPLPGGAAELLARCMYCNLSSSAPADGIDPKDDTAKLALARRILRKRGCPHVAHDE